MNHYLYIFSFAGGEAELKQKIRKLKLAASNLYCKKKKREKRKTDMHHKRLVPVHKLLMHTVLETKERSCKLQITSWQRSFSDSIIETKRLLLGLTLDVRKGIQCPVDIDLDVFYPWQKFFGLETSPVGDPDEKKRERRKYRDNLKKDGTLET